MQAITERDAGKRYSSSAMEDAQDAGSLQRSGGKYASQRGSDENLQGMEKSLVFLECVGGKCQEMLSKK